MSGYERGRPSRGRHGYGEQPVRRPANSSPPARTEDPRSYRGNSNDERSPRGNEREFRNDDRLARGNDREQRPARPYDDRSRGAGPSREAAPAPAPAESGFNVGRGTSQARVKEGATSNPGFGGNGGRRDRTREERMAIVTTRPSREFKKTGVLGVNLQGMTSNFFEILSKPNMHLMQYRVDFNPEIEHMGLKMGLLKNHMNTLGKHVFDGTLLYCTTKLPQPLELFSNRKSDGSAVGMTFRLVAEITKEDATYVHVMNIIIRRCLKMLDLTMVKRDYFDSHAAIPIPQHRIEIWPGYLTTIRHHENCYLMGVEIVHKVLRQDTAMNVIELMKREDRPDLWNQIKSALEGQVVMTFYNKRTYRVDEVTNEFSPLSTFHLRKEDREVTYMEYYEKRYNLKIKNPSQPMLISRPTRKDVNRGDDKPIFLIPELCGMTGLTQQMRDDFRVTQDVAVITRVEPDKRVQALMNFRKRLQDNPEIQRELSGWGLELARDLVRCEGRSIGETIKIVSGKDAFAIRNGDWTRDMDRRPMAVTAKVMNWVVFVPAGDLSQRTRQFVLEMTNCGRAQNLYLPEPRFIEMGRDRANNYQEELLKQCDQMQYDIAMVVSRSRRTDIYNLVKQVACCQLGIPTQVVTAKVICKQPHQIKAIATKVMVQMAAKMGAEPWRISLPPPPDKRRWMVIGYDTYHDAKQRKAVGAFVASVNESFTRYVSSVKIHENNEEISPSFNTHLQECTKAFYLQNEKQFPTDIFFYRDGVGAGDIERVKEVEIGALKEACRTISRIVGIDFNPNIAFIIVSKRISTRFFQTFGRGANNPPCGTVVDNTVTQFERYDFFLVSQKANRGTVSPTSFNIIEDNTGMTPDNHQKLAYGLTHLYYNWMGNLRVPAPIQYAHKLAYLVGEANMG